LSSINGFNKGKLKKAKTVDKSGPVTTTPKASASGGGGDSIAAMAMAARSKLATSGGNKTKSGRLMKAQSPKGPPTNVNLTSGLRKASTPEPARAPEEPKTVNFPGGLKKAAPAEPRSAPTSPANPNFTGGLKTTGANKTKSGRLAKAPLPSGAAPPPQDFRAGLKKNAHV